MRPYEMKKIGNIIKNKLSFFLNVERYFYYRYSICKIKEIKNIHKGKRYFIIGTGPSLNKTDLNLIKNEIIFGVNTLYRGLSRFDISYDYYAISDEVVWRKHFK